MATATPEKGKVAKVKPAYYRAIVRRRIEDHIEVIIRSRGGSVDMRKLEPLAEKLARDTEIINTDDENHTLVSQTKTIVLIESEDMTEADIDSATDLAP